MIAACHNVNAVCSRCGRTVRPPVRIADDIAEARRLADLVFRACHLDIPEHQVVAQQTRARLGELTRHLAAELAGDHALCSHPLAVEDLELDGLAARLHH